MLGTPVTNILKRLANCSDDSEKFATLLLLTKLVKPESITPETRSEIAESISVGFVCRLVSVPAEKENAELYRKIGLQIISTCFLQDEFLPELEKILPTFLEMEKEDDAGEILNFLAEWRGELMMEELAKRGVHSPYLVKVVLNPDDPPSPRLVPYLETLVEQIELEQPTSVDRNVTLVHDVLDVMEGFQSLALCEQSTERLLKAVEGLLRSRLPPPSRHRILTKGPYLTGTFPDWSATPLLFSLGCIELKVQLDKLVERDGGVPSDQEERLLIPLSQMVAQNLASLVASEEAGEAVWRRICDLRMVMESVGLFLQSTPHRGILLPNLLGTYLTWLADDVGVVESTIAVLAALSDYLVTSYRGGPSYPPLHRICICMTGVRALLHQLTLPDFRTFVTNSFGACLLRLSQVDFEGRTQVVFAPVLVELVSLDVYCEVPGEVDLNGMFSYREAALSDRLLSVIKTCCFLLLCLTKRRGVGLEAVCPAHTAGSWISGTVGFLLTHTPAPEDAFRGPWISATRVICDTIERCPVELALGPAQLAALLVTAKKAVGSDASDLVEILEELTVTG